MYTLSPKSGPNPHYHGYQAVKIDRICKLEGFCNMASDFYSTTCTVYSLPPHFFRSQNCFSYATVACNNIIMANIMLICQCSEKNIFNIATFAEVREMAY